MRRRNRILIFAGVVLVAAGLVAWFAVEGSGPQEPVYRGVPISKWLDGGAKARGYSSETFLAVVSSIGPEAIPWSIKTLEVTQRGRLEYGLFNLRVRIYERGTFFNRFLPIPGMSRSEGLRLGALGNLARIAPGTPYERDAVRAILKVRGSGVFAHLFENSRLTSLSSFTNCLDLILPPLIAGLSAPGRTTASILGLHNLGPSAIPALYQVALTEPGTNGPAEAALAQLDTNAWVRLMVEKRGG